MEKGNRERVSLRGDLYEKNPSSAIRVEKKVDLKVMFGAKKNFNCFHLNLDWDVVNPMPWKPVVDGFSSTPFLPMSFADSIKRGNFPAEVPFIVGFTSEEGLVKHLQPFIERMC